MSEFGPLGKVSLLATRTTTVVTAPGVVFRLVVGTNEHISADGSLITSAVAGLWRSHGRDGDSPSTEECSYWTWQLI